MLTNDVQENMGIIEVRISRKNKKRCFVLYLLLELRFILILALFSICLGCSNEKETKNKKKPILDLKSDEISIDTTNVKYEINLKKEVVFESSKKVIFDGYIGDIAIDKNGRIYITATKPGGIGIYVFEANGKFVTKFGEEGRGPGEFESIGSISVKNKKIYIFGPRLQKFGIFSVDNFQLIEDYIIRRDSLKREDDLIKMLRVFNLKISENNNLIAKMSILSRNQKNEIAKIIYHKVSPEGHILPKRILELDKYHFYFGKNELYPILMPFSRTTLVSLSGKDFFYTAWSDSFLIRKLDINGNYLKTFHFPFKRAPLTMSDLDLSNTQKRILRGNEIPKTWQALKTIETDSEDRLWVSTITESDSTFKWWVINEEGKVIATFTKPGKRSEISVMTKPLYKIKNGYFYELERNIRKGIDRVVKYRIEFVER